MARNQQFKRNRLSQAIAAACLSAIAAPALAGSGSCAETGANTIDTAVVQTCTLSAGDSVTVTGTGSISVDGDGVYGDTLVSGSYGAVRNEGAIDVSGYGVYLAGDASSVTNAATGTIDSDDSGIYLDAADVQGSIINAGEIAAGNSPYVYGDGGIYAYGSTVGGNISNSGSISSFYGGIYLMTTDVDGSVSNSNTIDTYDEGSRYGYGIYLYNGAVGDGVINSGDINSDWSGIYLEDMDVGGDVENRSSITAYSDSYGYGMYADSSTIVGGVTNSGSISSFYGGIYHDSVDVGGGVSNTATIDTYDGGSRYGYGIYLYNGAVGEGVINSGDITSDWSGIFLDSMDVAGSVRNEGTVSTYSTSYGYGVYVYNGTVGGNVTNSGSVSSYYGALYVESVDVDGNVTNAAGADLTSSDSYGIYVYSDYEGQGVAGNVTNSGSIESYYAGVHLGYTTIGGSVTNTSAGSILVTDSEAGIYLYDTDVTGSVTNAGEIDSDSEGSGYGIYAYYGDIGGSVTNSGSIDSAYSGIYLETMDIGGSVSNTASGTINASSEGYGIYTYDVGIGGSITNSGSIDSYYSGIYLESVDVGGNVSNTAGVTIDSGAYGIYVYSDYDGLGVVGDVVNAGTVLSDNQGIYIENGTVGGSVVNSGSIESGQPGMYVYVTTVGGDVSNSGSVVADNGAGIVLYDGDVTGSVINSGSVAAADGDGIFVRSTIVQGDVVNTSSGEIMSDSHGMEVRYSEVYGEIRNDGYIYSDSGRGLSVEDTDGAGTIVNSGSITSSDGGFGIYVYNNSFTADVVNSGYVRGGLYIDEGDMTNNGVVDISYSGFGTYINGDYIQGSGGLLRLYVNSTSTYDRLNVNNAGTFEGTGQLGINVDQDHTLVDGDTISGVISTGGLTASGFDVGDNSLALNFSAEIDGDDVDLVVEETGLTTVSDAFAAGSNPASLDLAAQLDDFLDDVGPDNEIGYALGDASSWSDVIGIATAMSVSSLGSTLQSGAAAVRETGRTIGGRQAGKQGLASGDTVQLSRNIWLSGFDGSAEQDDVGAVPGYGGYEADISGFTFGADMETDANWTVGVAISVADTETDGDLDGGALEVDSDLLMTSLYASYDVSASTTVNLQATVGSAENESSRTIGAQVASADYDSDVSSVSATIMQKREGGSLTLAPYGFAEYLRVDTEGFTETGAGVLNQTLSSDTLEEMVFGVGALANVAVGDNLSLIGDLSLGYDLRADSDSTITGSFANGGVVFTEVGVSQHPLVYGAGIGARYGMGERSDVTVSYDYSGRESYDSAQVSLKVNWKF